MTLWSGRVSGEPDSAVLEFLRAADAELLPYDCRATLVHAYAHPRKLLAPHQGDVQVLPDGHLFVGWGGIPYFTELDGMSSMLTLNNNETESMTAKVTIFSQKENNLWYRRSHCSRNMLLASALRS